ncbi:MAG: hypothetical protein R3192_10340 [Woeseiaceae bacterium]|nr:hypothetical protein [Woeseiaceae bacterium]
MTITNRHLCLTTLSIVLFLPALRPVLAQAAGAALLFDSHDVMSVRIEAPISTLMQERPDEEYLDGKFFYADDSGNEVALDLKLQTRGITRRKKDICNFPPIRLNFRKKQVEGTLFAGQDKLKLVTHCQANKPSFEQLVLREYIAYRILQTITDKSFRSRLMHITYLDTEDDNDPAVKYGFVIEDEDNLGERIGMTAAKVSGIKVEELDLRHANLISVFEYLIGNTDFSLILGPADKNCCHNAVLYGNGGPPYTSIPYDFDYSGIVNAPYAAPNPRFKLRSVKQRLYRGRCVNNDLLDETFAHYLDKEAEIRSLVDNLEGLDERDGRDVHNYLNAFYKDITNPKMKQRRFIRDCL